jgi:hypothetical protein
VRGFIFILGLMLVAISGRAAEMVPDFKLVNVNTNSARPLAEVSPRDYLLQVSGYYFGDAG